MDETRVNRYKEYRQSFIKEGSIASDSENSTAIDLSATTSTLPMDQVINAVQEEQNREYALKKHKRNVNIKLLIEIVVAVIVVAGLVVLGIFAWRK